MIAYAVYTSLVLVTAAVLYIAIAPALSPWYLASALVLSLFLIGYVKYAESEWGRYPASAWTALSSLLYFALFSSLVVGGWIQAAVASSAIFLIAIFLARRAGGVKLWGESPLKSIIAAGRVAPKAALIGTPGLNIIVAAYELYRIYARSPAAGYAALIGLVLAAFAPALPPVATGDWWGHGVLRLWIFDVALWPGLITWEELISRAALSAFGWAANYMFVVLHAPKLIAYAIAEGAPYIALTAPLVLGIISYATRAITEVYEKHGLVGAITAHALYNAVVSWAYYLGMWDVFVISAIVTAAWWLASLRYR